MNDNRQQFTSGLTFSGTLCPECGYIHPVPKNGICPVANPNNIEGDVNNSNSQHTNDSNDILSTKNIEIMKIKNMINKLISEKYDTITFDNNYKEEKFFKNIYKILEDNLKEFLNGFVC